MMETQKGKTVPTVKNFQVEGSWVPTTPVKPTLPHLGQIYENGEVEAYLSRYNHQNQAQTLLSYSITSAETSSMNIPASSSSNINNFWDDRINLERESVEMQRRGLEDYLPHWNNQGRRTKINYPPVNPGAGQDGNFPYLNSWESSLQWRSNGVRDNGGGGGGGVVLGHDHLDQLHNAPLSFGDLLALNGSAAYLPGWDCNSAAHTSSNLNGNSMFCNQSSLQQHNLHQNNLHQNNLHQNNLHPNNLHRYDQQIRDIFGDVQSCASPHPYQGIYGANSPLFTKQANGKTSTFAPATPDSRWRIDSNMALGNTPLGPYQGPINEQNGLSEQDVAAAMVNLQNVHEEVVVPNTADSSPGKASMAVESHSPDKKGDQIIDLNKTPQKKTRRRRYQPKVLSEKKPRRTPKPKTPKVDTDSKETAPVKRKYVRKNKVNPPSTPPIEGVAEAGEPTPKTATEAEATKPNGKVKSCKKSLNFDLNGEAAESIQMPNGDSYIEPQPNKCDTTGDQHGHTVHLRQEELVVDTSRVGTAYDLNRETCQELKNYLSLPTEDHPGISQSRNEFYPGQSPNSSPCASSNEREQARGTKRNNSCITDANAGSVDASPCTFRNPNNTNSTIGELHKIFFPEICKKKRTEKVIRAHVSSMSTATAPPEYVNQAAVSQSYTKDPTASKYYCNPAPYGVNVVTEDHAKVLMGSVEKRVQLTNTWPDLARLKKKKRSKGSTRVRNLDPLKGIASPSPGKPGPKGPRKKKINNDSLQPPTSNSIHFCTETPPADSKAKPKPKRRSRKQKSSNQWDLVVYSQSTRKATGSFPALPWVKTISSSVQEITEGLRLLDINRESCNASRQEQNALVLYQGKNQDQNAQNALVVYGKDGTMVPFDGPFDPIKKRRQRAKVDLDDETTRVWRLLLENIDNKGIDGSDEDKAKWWENERSVFRGRVDSFIARMRLVQGDRRFTPWKGSVLDSVIGVFLTQNVSDHLSSSAFMSLAAQFPLKSEGSESTLSEESTTGLVEEPDVIEPEESITWKTTMDQRLFSTNPTTLHVIDHIEEKEVVNSKEPRAHGSVSPKGCSSESSQKVNNTTSKTAVMETTILGDDRAKDDATSSQHSVMSSQNSINSPNLQTAGIKSIFSESSSRTQHVNTSSQGNYFDCSTTFLELLKMAESPFLHEPYSQIQHGPLQCMNHVTKGSLETQGVCPNGTLLNLNYQSQDTKGIEMLEVESRYPDTSRKDENSSPTEQSNLTTESTVQHLALERSSDSIPRSFAENTCSFYVLEGEKMVRQTHRQSVEPSDTFASSVNKQTTSTSKSTNFSQVTTDVTESTAEVKRASNDQKEVEQISVQTYASGGISDFMNPNANKSKKGKAGKGKNDAFDWDSLRREAQADGKVRERPANTRDSLDWEAVRHAHVSEIAETIKERGMNNMLAERIKDLLDRLVKDHGSTDMEWLRDIPPDKAKEYLLSFRGLGLKSVECVRLLTLHHLAFPVDTNVGRIAVRLGWVPLQPLPESLQLHLLELYPILESIQKFLWPRLCKLDQKTLYELHYHLITFGKVFCTKRQPNCNACPLRGECKHFASAFASARFALPGTEEKSIMPSNGANSANPHPQASANFLPLPPTWSNQHSHSNSRCDRGAPLLEISSSPLALPSSQTMNQLERQSENRNCEPIVEVPASPEPEPEREQTLCDIEDASYEDPNEIPTIKLNMTEFTQSIEKFIQGNTDLQEVGKSNALVALTPDAASIPTPKLKNINRLRTEHHVYELPDRHPLLERMDKREPDDPSSYLFAIWTPGETADSIQPPERTCNPEDPSKLCNSDTCSFCNSMREANSQIVRGTLLIPCRTAMRGSFPLNGTYFQVNEVFADHDSSLNPIAVPRSWLWQLPRRTVYFGTSIPTIFRGLTTEDIQQCFWRGFVCVRGFDKKRRAPRPLMARLHFPASRMPRGTKGKAYDE